MPGLTNCARFGALAAIVICATTSGIVFAQDMPDPRSPAPVIPPATPAPAAPTSQPPQANAQPAPAQPAAQKLSEAQLDLLIAPVALYPDPILSQVLTASTYPLEVVEAAHWVQQPANKSLTGDALTEALKNQNWDPSVIALVPYPRVLAMMADRVQWTEQLGNAFLAQQAEIMAEVQKFRHELKVAPQVTAATPAAPKRARYYAYRPTYHYAYHYSPYYYGPAPYYYGPAPYHGDGY